MNATLKPIADAEKAKLVKRLSRIRGQVDALQRAITEQDAPSTKLLQQATTMGMQDVGIIPLHIQKNVWAMRATLAHTPRVDEETRAMDVRPK